MTEDSGGRPPMSRSSVASLAALIVFAAGAFAFLYRMSSERILEERKVRPVEFPLGAPVVRTLSNGAPFAVSVTLTLDSSHMEPDRLRAEMEGRRETLRQVVSREVLGRKREEEFRPAERLKETLKLEIRERLNLALQREGFGASLILSVDVAE